MRPNGAARDIGVARSSRARPIARRVADSPPVDGRVGRESGLAGSPVDRGEQADSRRQGEVFWELIQGCARAGAGSLTPLQGGVR
jgi:hypothetical protein